MKKILLIAGNGRFPIIFSKSAKKHNVSICCVAINDETDRSIEAIVDKTYWLDVTDFEKFFQILKDEKIKLAVMAGKITKKRLVQNEFKTHSKIGWFLKLIPDRGDDSMLRGVARILALRGVRVISSTTYMEEHLVKKGCITERVPKQHELEDIRFGRMIAKRVGAADVGQSIVVKNKAVIAVEAIEGTDEAIMRGGKLGGEKTVVIKMAKPYQDLRFDIPVIGPGTVESLIEAKAKTLAVESGKTLIIDREKVIVQANAAKISIVGI